MVRRVAKSKTKLVRQSAASNKQRRRAEGAQIAHSSQPLTCCVLNRILVCTCRQLGRLVSSRQVVSRDGEFQVPHTQTALFEEPPPAPAQTWEAHGPLAAEQVETFPAGRGPEQALKTQPAPAMGLPAPTLGAREPLSAETRVEHEGPAWACEEASAVALPAPVLGLGAPQGLPAPAPAPRKRAREPVQPAHSVGQVVVQGGVIDLEVEHTSRPAPGPPGSDTPLAPPAPADGLPAPAPGPEGAAPHDDQECHKSGPGRHNKERQTAISVAVDRLKVVMSEANFASKRPYEQIAEALRRVVAEGHGFWGSVARLYAL